MRHAVIMAGGAGTRLWPLSRQARPKHFLRLFDGRSLLRRAYERLNAVLPSDNIHVITSAAHLGLVARDLPELPTENLIGEPAVRDTANAVGLSAFILKQFDPHGVMGVFTADHMIEPLDRFAAALDTAYRAAEQHPEALVTFGINPLSAHTGYGYIHRGAPLEDGLYQVRAFKEKPDPLQAQSYVQSGEYYWNSGMFVWRIETILDHLSRYLPGNFQKLSRLEQVGGARGRSALEPIIREIYPQLEKISIDYAVLEKARPVVVCPMDCRWLDVGAWTSLSEILGTDADGNVRAHGNVITMDCTDSIYVGEDNHLLATIGLRDIVVVHSRDATLICHRDQVQRIKDLVNDLDHRYR